MFTGLIECLGEITNLKRIQDDIILSVKLNNIRSDSKIVIGDSIAINGVCLTVVGINGFYFSFDVSTETLNKTSLKLLTVGSFVNIEQAMKVSDRLGGHIVSGHVDGMVKLTKKFDDGRSIRLIYTCDSDSVSRFIAEKGSVCLDGVSLTVNKVTDNCFGVNIIPHTWKNTIMQFYTINQKVNIEVDVIARYVSRMMQVDKQDEMTDKSINYQDLNKL